MVAEAMAAMLANNKIVYKCTKNKGNKEIFGTPTCWQ
jgi:hypothetical protein